jgi:hypothetical protein
MKQAKKSPAFCRTFLFTVESIEQRACRAK